jgi:hypothetical protein
MKTATDTSRGEERISAELNGAKTASGAGAGRLGATSTAGCWSRTTQQFAWTDRFIWDARAQQLCCVFCLICRQVPNGMHIAPMSTMAKLARWKAPIFIGRVYHSVEFGV